MTVSNRSRFVVVCFFLSWINKSKCLPGYKSRMKVCERRLDESDSKSRMRMLVMKLMMRSYFRLMVGRNQSDCYIQLWESKTSQSGRPFSPSDASRRLLSP